VDTTQVYGSENAHRLLLASALKRDDDVAGRGRPCVEDAEPDETLVEDQRESMRPAQHVERKLVAMLHASPILVSHLQKDSRPRAR
jgi:hypothetical protein